jgi:hypothetical protein
MGERLAANQTAVFGWVFVGLWLSILAAFTELIVREGGFGQFAAPIEFGLLSIFWVFGIAAARYVADKPIVLLEARMDGLRLIQRRLWRVEATSIPYNPPPKIALVQTVDSEGDPYFELRLCDLAGAEHIIAESCDRERLERIDERLRAALQAKS